MTNLITTIGRQVADPTQNTAGGQLVTNFTLASDTRKDKDGNMGANFYRVSVWGKLGENCMKFLHKGDKAFVQGDLELRTYKNKEGVNTPQLTVNCTNVEFLTDRRGNNDSDNTHAYTTKQNQDTQHTTTTEDDDRLPF